MQHLSIDVTDDVDQSSTIMHCKKTVSSYMPPYTVCVRPPIGLDGDDRATPIMLLLACILLCPCCAYNAVILNPFNLLTAYICSFDSREVLDNGSIRIVTVNDLCACM